MGETNRLKRPTRPERPKRQSGSELENSNRPRRPEKMHKSTTFVNEEEEELFEDEDFSEDFTEGSADFEGFEQDEDLSFEEFPDEDYEDFSTHEEKFEEIEELEEVEEVFEEEEEEAPRKRPARPQRSKRPTRRTRDEDDEEEEDDEELKVQVRHRRVRANETEEEKPQMFSFSSDINKMTVNTMLEDVRVDDYDFDDEGNLVKKENNDIDESKSENTDTMQAVESLEELLGSLDESSVMGTDEELGKEIDKSTRSLNETESKIESKDEVERFELAKELEAISMSKKQSIATQDSEVAEEVKTERKPKLQEYQEELQNTEAKLDSKLEDYKDDAEPVAGSLLDRIQSIAFKYKEKVLNNEIENLSDIIVRYKYDGDYCATPSNKNSLAMPNCKVYKNGRAQEWTKAQEIRLNTGDRITIDFGLDVVLPRGYGMKVIYSEKLLTKFGLDPVETRKVFNNLEAATALSLSFIARNPMSYVARYQTLVELEVVKLNGTI